MYKLECVGKWEGDGGLLICATSHRVETRVRQVRNLGHKI